MIKVYNKEKTKILDTYDLDKGHLINDVLITHIPEIKEIKEEGHYETIAEYPNGGKDIKWIIDVPGVEGKEAYDIKEDIYIYIPYTDKELKNIKLKKELSNYIQKLYNTDHWALKYAEGFYTEEEYEEKKAIRESYRVKVRELNKEIEGIKNVEETTEEEN